MSDLLEALKSRRSQRNFVDNKPIPRKHLEQIIDCARLAATARNVQPWEFVVVTDQGIRQQIAEIATTGKFIAQASACVIVFCQDTKYYLEDGCAATENILLAAASLGISSCWVAGDKKPYDEEIRSLLSVPQGYKLISFIALGYAGEEVERVPKRPLTEVLHWEKF
jgi:nitroreductase